MPTDVECYVSTCSIIRLVYCAFIGPFRERLGGQVVSGGYLAMVIISTLMLPAHMRTGPPHRRQHGQLRAHDAAAAPEDDIAKKMMLHLAMNYNKIALSWLHARVKESTTRVRRQEVAHSAPYRKEWVGGRVGLRQGPSSLNPAGVNGLIPAKK